jgi:hypothetical protein
LRAAPDKIKLPAHELNDRESILATGAERDENKAGGERKHDEHPVLAVEAKKGKVLDQKVQRPRAPMFWDRISVPASKIYYFYIFPGDPTGRRRQSAAMSSQRD